MAETRYYKDKIYVPLEIREKLKLADGDIIRFQVTAEGVAKIEVLRVSKATERLLQRLENPPNLGPIKGSLRRREIYEDLA